jgi:hypothetical protein
LYREVEIERTDVNGNALLYIHPFDVWYRFVLNWNGHSTVTPPGRISASTMTLETSDVSYSTYVYLSTGVTVNCSENVSVKTVACVVDDPSGLGSNYRFTVRDLNVRGTVLCSQSLPGASSVTFTCNATNASNNVEYVVSVDSGSGWFVLKDEIMELPFSPPLGMVGLLAAWVLITGMAFLGLPNGPSGAALFALGGLVFAVLAQFMVAPEIVIIFFAVIVGLAVVKSRT